MTAVKDLPVAGEKWPWCDPHGYPYRPHPVGGNGEIFQRGAEKAGVDTRVGPVAITNGRFGNRPHCIYRGFCLQGCKVNAKASPLITHAPDALARGAEIRPDAMVTRVEADERTGRATVGVCAASSGPGAVHLPDGLCDAKFEQVKPGVSDIPGGDVDAAGFIRQGIKQQARQYLPGQKED
jgi:hypothetical protein